MDELQVLVRKILACKSEFLGEANQALKHQFTQNLRDPYFIFVARDNVCLPLTLRVLHSSGVYWH